MKFMQKTLFTVLPCVMLQVLPSSVLATQEVPNIHQPLPLNYDANDDYFQQFDTQDNYQYVPVVHHNQQVSVDVSEHTTDPVENVQIETAPQPELQAMVQLPMVVEPTAQTVVETPTLLDDVLPTGFEHRVAIEPEKNTTKVNKPVVVKAEKTATMTQTTTANTTKTDTPKPVKSSNKVDSLIAKAKKMLGVPYRYGGTSPSTGFDCSGFMQYVFKDTISLPRTSNDMAQVGKKVSRSDLKAGDMVFFAHSGSRISHVGMYLGAGQFIHSPSTGKTIEITSMNSKYWSGRFITARRVVES